MANSTAMERKLGKRVFTAANFRQMSKIAQNYNSVMFGGTGGFSFESPQESGFLPVSAEKAECMGRSTTLRNLFLYLCL